MATDEIESAALIETEDSNGRLRRIKDPGKFDRYIVLSIFFAITVIIFAILLQILTFYTGEDAAKIDPPLEIFAMLAGATGAFLSMLLKGFKEATEVKDVDKIIVPDTWMSFVALFLFPILIGLIAGLIMYVLLASQFLQGEILPRFVCKTPNGQCDSYRKLTLYWCPKEATDYLRTLLWCFISGFSQRIVIGDINKIIDFR